MSGASDKTAGYLIEGQPFSARPAGPGLYLVATPIGNLADITLNALNILAGADYILCEDTRVSAKLLSRYAIHTPLRPYHDHNGARMRPLVIEDIRAGKQIALISDAGTPLVSDPGYKLVEQLTGEGLVVHMAPGASAPLAALALSGLPSDRFQFTGFLPAKTAARKKALAAMIAYGGTSICFDSARRIVATLGELEQLAPDCKVAIARELTKKYEEIIRGTAGEVAGELAGRTSLKGEITLVLRPRPPEPVSLDDEAVQGALGEALQQMSASRAASKVAACFGLQKRELYPLAVRLREEQNS